MLSALYTLHCDRCSKLMRDWSDNPRKKPPSEKPPPAVVAGFQGAPRRTLTDLCAECADEVRVLLDKVFAGKGTVKRVRAKTAIRPGSAQHGYLVDRIDTAEISVRTLNALHNAAVEWVCQLVVMTERDVLKTKNLGRKCLNEIKEYLSGMGLRLGTPASEVVAMTGAVASIPSEVHQWVAVRVLAED